MFTKVSERLCLAFIVKMGKTPTQRIRANELRRIKKSKRRQAYFVSDYIQAKYFHLYCEAANFFNALNILYPTKPDLRKTVEFRNWRTAIVTSQGNNKPKQQPYESIDTICLQNQQYECQSPENTESQPQSPESHQPQSPESHQPQSPESHQPQSPESHQPQSPESHQPQSPESHQPQSPESHRWKDNMELKIPLMNYKRQTATVTTKTLEIVTEETIEQSDIQYDAVNDLTDARIDEIIEQLRQDPELNNIFNEMDFDEGIDIDNDIYDIRLENELLTW